MNRSRVILLAASVLLSGCVNQMLANRSYEDQSAIAAVDKKECAQGDKQECLKVQRVATVCNEMVARGDTSATALLCKRMIDAGDLTVNPQ